MNRSDEILQKAKAEIDDPELYEHIPKERWDEVERLMDHARMLMKRCEGKERFPHSWKGEIIMNAREALIESEKALRRAQAASSDAKWTKTDVARRKAREQEQLSAKEADRLAKAASKRSAAVEAQRIAKVADPLPNPATVSKRHTTEDASRKSTKENKSRPTKEDKQRPATVARDRLHRAAVDESRRVAEVEAAGIEFEEAFRQIPGFDPNKFVEVVMEILEAKRHGRSIPLKEYKQMVRDCIRDDSPKKRAARSALTPAQVEDIMEHMTHSLSSLTISASI